MSLDFVIAFAPCARRRTTRTTHHKEKLNVVDYEVRMCPTGMQTSHKDLMSTPVTDTNPRRSRIRTDEVMNGHDVISLVSGANLWCRIHGRRLSSLADELSDI